MTPGAQGSCPPRILSTKDRFRSRTFAAQTKRILASRQPASSADSDARPAAVLVPLYFAEGEWHPLLTRRTERVEDPKSQVAFPGGRRDPEEDSAETTALREAEEEIGLFRVAVAVLGRLDDVVTVTHWRVTPVVAEIPHPYRFTLNERECAALFGVPLCWLGDPAHRSCSPYTPSGGQTVTVHRFREYAGHTIWGATAKILRNLLVVPGFSS